MDKAEAIKKLHKYKKLLSDHINIDKLILFGSHAHGNPKEDSDIDVAVVVKKITGDYFSVTPILWRLRRDIDDRIEPLLFEKGADKSGFLEEISKSGIVI